MGERQSMIVHIKGNIDALRKSLADGTGLIDGTAVKMRELSKPTESLNASFSKFDSVLASVGINIGTEARALGELSMASGQTAGSLGTLTTAGLVAGAAMAGWKIGRVVSDFFNLDEAIGNATAKLLGWGDVAGEVAANNMAVLARASKLAGTEITSLHLATEILSGAAKSNAEAVNTSANRIAGWGQEIAKVKSEGNWSKLTEDLKSQHFELKELSDRYHISVEAIEFFSREQKKADDAVTESNKRKTEALKEASAAQKEAAERAARMAEATDHLKLAQGDYLSVLAQFDQQLVSNVQHYMELGLSVQDISTLMGVSESTIGRVTDALVAQNQTLSESALAWEAMAEANRQANEQALAQTTASLDAQRAAFKKASDEIVKSQQKMSEWNSRTYDLSTDAGMAEFKKLNPAASIGNIPQGYFDTHTLQDAIRDGIIDLYAGYRTGARGFAGGVRNFEGGPAIVGERGPELVTLPRGSNVIPNHELGGVTVVVNVNGSVLGDPQKIAEAVGRAFDSRRRSIGMRQSVGA